MAVASVQQADVPVDPASGPDPDHGSSSHILTARAVGERPVREPLWLLLTVGTVVLGGLIPLIAQPRYYFFGDTQIGAFGQWYDLGRQLRAGHWPLLDLGSWRAGNYVSEGQWGLFSPLTIAIALAASTVTHIVLFVTVVKLALLVTAGVGTYLLTRSYHVPPYGCYVAGVAVTLGGATQYLESPSWVTGQMVWALLPVAWWGMRRTMIWRRNPFPALVFGLLIVTVGYVYGTIYLALVVVACLVDAGRARNWVGFAKVFGIGACCGLVAATVYLPGILTASVTIRGGFEIISAGRLQNDLQGLVTSMIPTVRSLASPSYPAQYVAWFLPMLAWVDWSRARRLVRPLNGLLIVLGATVLWSLGPNQIGPLRWPIRVMPVVALTAIVLTVVLLARAGLRRPSGGRLVASLLVTAMAAFLIASRFWSQREMTFVSAAVVGVGLVVAWTVLRLGARGRSERQLAGVRAAAVFVAIWSLVVMGLQHHYFPSPPSLDRHMPGTVAGYALPASTAQGDVMVIGDPTDTVTANGEVARDFLLASSWFVSPHSVQNVYTTIGFATYNSTYCMAYNGTTCKGALTKLFEAEPRTGLDRVDLLSVSTLHIFRKGLSEKRLLDPPDGWHVTEQTAWAVTWVRDQPVAPAGGVVWSSAGLRSREVSSTARRLELKLDEVPASGGTLVLSRLDWPGYSVDGGTLAAPTDGYLVTVDVPAGAAGRTVTVDFAPPGWTVERAALALGTTAAVLWSVTSLGLARRRRLRHDHRADVSGDQPGTR